MKLMKVYGVILIVFFLYIAVCIHGYAAAGDQTSTNQTTVQLQILQIDQQIQGLKNEIRQLEGKKRSLYNQIEAIKTQRRLDQLNGRLSDLSIKLTNAQAKTNSAQIQQLTSRQSQINSEIGFLTDIKGLLGQLAAANQQMDTNQTSLLEQKIKNDRESIKALFPPATNQPPAVKTVNTNITPAATSAQADPEIQPLLDQIKALDAQIKQDLDQIKSLQEQKKALIQHSHKK